ncbi:NAD-dependent epimerase/dehydratase family protein [Devosia algicola]|uniref:NAD-dependent epimerase/dehydratase family protein n=1 Tax=Devosia algicola TaxID=3026418 RepID=A0ABY7YL37_9HYPH|nr:NAD-dependent epimerase/dehydratase family protein [Devosia algicola]WDR01909.1 NAD-dependent epimerase/dehydratase family protein [Devosia algicola]
MNFFFFGLGYSSQASAAAIRKMDANAPIGGTVRSADKLPGLRDRGLVADLFDGNAPNPALVPRIEAASHVVNSIAPDASGDAVLNHYGTTLVGSNNLEWLCYFSTVGVYGNFDGAWIDESAPCAPINHRSQQRVVVEQAWRDFAAAKNVPLLILRLAGIYGPGRSSFDKLLTGTAKRIVKSGQVFNRIHVVDIARVTALAAQQKLAGTFNLADDEPAAPQDIVTLAAAMAGREPPPEIDFEQAEMTPMARSFYADNKKVSNKAIKQALGIELLYPSLQRRLASDP